MEPPEHVLESRPPRRALGVGAAAAVAVAMGSTLWAYLEYATRARASMLAFALAGMLFGVGFALFFAFRSTFTFTRVQGPRPAPAHDTSEAPLDLGTRDVGTSARRGFVALLAGAGASLLATLLLPFRSLGTSPRPTLYATAWRRGIRLLTVDGRPLRPTDLAPGSATPVVPSASPADPNSVAVLVRLRDTPDVRAYSRICTHAGCAVCVFRARESALVCPCHHSTFDAADGGRILAGPASQPLPELPLGVDADGFLVADGDFNRRVGPRGG